jgi:outer membrane protein assembly factor BamB
MSVPARPSILALLVLLLASPLPATEVWHSWGGPRGDFHVDAPALLEKWPETGPTRIWSRELGDGYSAIAADEGRLTTMYRDGETEVVICLDAGTGKTLWKHSSPAPLSESIHKEFGVGPRAMPLLASGRLFTVGITGLLQCLDPGTGKVHWQKSVYEDLGGKEITFGYACTPVPFGETILLPVGGTKGSVVALSVSDGSLVWGGGDFGLSYATPLLTEVDGDPHLVAFMARNVVGLDPRSGKVHWSVHHENQWGTNCTTPVLGPGGKLFVTTEETGSRLLRLHKKGDSVVAEEAWFERRPQVVFTNVLLLGTTLIGSMGVNTAPLTGLDLDTGSILWRERGFNKANVLLADGKLIILDEDGELGLAVLEKNGLDIRSRCQLLEKSSWTVPTLIGSRLYARDRKTIVALEIGKDRS